MKDLYPQRIVCLTEETTEWLYLLGEEARIVGISGYTVRPPRARQEKPKVSAFLSAKIDKILALQPDCVFGFSDLQADIAAQLIRHGVQVTVFNQRSVAEIFAMLYQVAAMVGQAAQGLQRITQMQAHLDHIRAQVNSLQAAGARRPRVYFEEWDEPRLSAIQWVSELIEATGGENIFKHKIGSLAVQRAVTDSEVVALNPDIIIGCWCGKKVKTDSFAQRPDYREITAIRKNQVFEVDPAIFLQPGPALFVDGLDQLFGLLAKISSCA